MAVNKYADSLFKFYIYVTPTGFGFLGDNSYQGSRALPVIFSELATQATDTA